MLGALIGAGANLIGGLLGRQSANKANDAAARHAAEQMEAQKTFAQHGIRWRVEDAKRAGIHPLYALGAPTVSYSPTAFSHVADDSMAKGVASMGQDISRAIDSTRTAGERSEARIATALNLKNAELRNELLAAQIAKLRQSGPPMPGGNATLQIGGVPFGQDPMTSDTEAFTTRYGEMADFFYGPRVWWQDFKKSTRDTERRLPMSERTRIQFGKPPAWLSRAGENFSRATSNW